MTTITKRYSEIPFAHRAHRDPGHCSRIHGHSWTFEFTWAGEPDERGWVLDFGALGWLRDYINANFDHACLFNADDPALSFLLAEFGTLFKPLVMPSCSSEGIARYLYEAVSKLCVRQGIIARLLTVTVREDSKNSATYTPIPTPDL